MRTAVLLARNLLACLFFVWAASAHARPLDDVVAGGSLRVIAYLDNAPFSWEENGEYKGIDVDLARAIAKGLGIEAEVILRMQGEKADDDLRANVWRGALTGGGVGDIMMHVPIDRDFAARNPEAVLGNPYFQERVAVFIDETKLPADLTFDIFKKEKIGVQLGSASDYFLMTFDDGSLIDNVNHFVKPTVGVQQFVAKEYPAIMGVRSNIEGLLHQMNATAKSIEPVMDGIVRSNWLIGMAWKQDSRDLGYAVQGVLEQLKTSGEMQKIFTKYGVKYVEPPVE